jgi:hypothetical protein
VDLVNEILETLLNYCAAAEWLHQPLLPARHELFQTNKVSAELMAYLKDINQVPNNPSSQAVFPFNLPFNLWIEEIRIYLQHLGIEKAGLWRSFCRILSCWK